MNLYLLGMIFFLLVFIVSIFLLIYFIKDEKSLKEVTNGSEFVDKTIKQWLDDVEPKQREIVIDTIFDILSTTEAESMIQIREKWFKNVGIMLKNYKNLDEDSKKMIGEIVRKLVIVAKDNFVDEMPSFGKKK